MNKLEVAQLLTVASGVDNRKVTPEVVEVWFPIVGHLDYQASLASLKLHFTESTDWLLPAHIIRGAARLRESTLPPRHAIESAECRHLFKGGWCVVCPTREPDEHVTR